MTAEERVKLVYPEAECYWTSRGWRIMVPGEESVIGRTDSGHVPASDAWADALRRIEAAKEAKG
jgi:hypothetical protein